MESYEYLKNKRELLGISVRDFAKLADISPSNVFYYETGQYKLYNLSIKKFLHLFSLLKIDPQSFSREYFVELYKDVDNRLSEWKEDNKREYSYKILKKRYRLRIAKIAERRSVSEDKLENIKNEYDRVFNELRDIVDEDVMDDEMYDQYIIPLSALIRLSMDNKTSENTDTIAERINYKLAYTDYDYRDLAYLSDTTFRLFALYRKNPEDYHNLKTATAFKVAYLLDTDIEDLFQIE